MQRIITIVIILLLTKTLFGQHTIRFDKRIRDKVLNDQTGILLIQTPDSIYGINLTTRGILWKQAAPEKLDFSSYSEIPFTPLVIFDRKALLSSGLLSNTLGTKGTSRTILNVNDGRVLFDSEAKGFGAVNNTMLMPEREAIFVDGIKGGQSVISFYNYKSNQQLWETSLEDTNVLKTVKSTLFDREKVALDADKNIFWLKKKLLLKIDSRTGAVLFEEKDVDAFEISDDGTQIFIFSTTLKLKKLNNESLVQGLTTRTLNPMWDKDPRVWGTIQESDMDAKTLIIITSKGFNTIDKTTGQKQWDRSSFLPLIKRIIPIQDGFIVAQDKFLNHINAKGKKTWEDPVKISLSGDENPIQVFEDGGSVMYITPSMANKISIDSGKKAWEDVVLNSKDFITRNLKLKEHPYHTWFDEHNEQFPVFSKNRFYIFNNNADTAPKSNHTFDFESTAYPNLKVIDQGYFLNHKNDFYVFDTSGSIRYRKTYNTVDNTSIFRKSTYWIKRSVKTYTSAIGFTANQINQTLRNVIVSKDIGFFNKVASGVYGSYQSYQEVIDKVTSVNSLRFDSSLQTIFKRIEKGQQDRDGILVVVPTSKKKLKIIRLHINTGEEELLKELKEDRSDFIIDQLENTIYFFSRSDVVIEQL